MPSFSKRSLASIHTCDVRLQRVLRRAIRTIDFTVLCGHRCQEDQDKAFAEGKSKLRWPKSKHNAMPSLAVDIVPYPIDWNDLERFKTLAAVVMECAKQEGVKLRHGADWNGNGRTDDERFHDWPHFELV